MSGIKLSPCPFCGGEANIGSVKYSDNSEEVKRNNRNVGYFGQCIQCAATMNFGLSYETEEIAVAKWNRRYVTKDKNGNDVFAGDRVSFWLIGCPDRATGIIEWQQKAHRFVFIEDSQGDKWGFTDENDIERIEEGNE